MSRLLKTLSLSSLALGAAFAGSALLAQPAQAFEDRYDRGYEYGREFRPPPPAMHGYWGHRRWRRWHDGYGFRPPPPPPPPRYGYGYGYGYGRR